MSVVVILGLPWAVLSQMDHHIINLVFHIVNSRLFIVLCQAWFICREEVFGLLIPNSVSCIYSCHQNY